MLNLCFIRHARKTKDTAVVACLRKINIWRGREFMFWLLAGKSVKNSAANSAFCCLIGAKNSVAQETLFFVITAKAGSVEKNVSWHDMKDDCLRIPTFLVLNFKPRMKYSTIAGCSNSPPNYGQRLNYLDTRFHARSRKTIKQLSLNFGNFSNSQAI